MGDTRQQITDLQLRHSSKKSIFKSWERACFNDWPSIINVNELSDFPTAVPNSFMCCLNDSLSSFT